MCLAVPMRLIETTGGGAGVAELEGVRYSIDTSLIDAPQVGDYLVVHAGFAIERLDETEAEKRLALFSELASSMKEDAQDNK